MSDEKGYNGYTNYETWSVALLIDNDQGSERYWREVAQQCWDNASAGSICTREQQARYYLADMMKDEHEENNPLTGQCTIYDQLLGAALSEVDWDDVAEHYIDQVERDIEGVE